MVAAASLRLGGCVAARAGIGRRLPALLPTLAPARHFTALTQTWRATVPTKRLFFPLCTQPATPLSGLVPASRSGDGAAGVAGTSIAGARPFSTRKLHGRLFYKRRPKFVPRWRYNWRSKWLEGVGTRKGVCTKVFVTNPKKPNSGMRKVAYVRLSNDRVVKVYIPGIGHNLQVHSVVMVRGGRKRDVIGCNLTAMRGHYDLLPVKNRTSSRSKYGIPRPNYEPERKRFERLTTAVDRRLEYYKTGDRKWLTEYEKDPPKSILHVVRSNPPITYRHRSAKKK